jgi:hypothetical protein
MVASTGPTARDPVRASLPLLLFLLIGILLSGGGCGSRESPSDLSGPRVFDLSDGLVNPFGPFQSNEVKALVFLFVSTDCPISNRYAPQVKRLHERFGPRGVGFRLVYPNPSTSAAAARRHLEEYGYGFGGLRDPQHALVRRAGATVTPEAAVFGPDGRLLYRGRIDDRFPALGTERGAPTQHDLENALSAILEGRPVTNRLTRATGCYIADLP